MVGLNQQAGILRGYGVPLLVLTAVVQLAAASLPLPQSMKATTAGLRLDAQLPRVTRQGGDCDLPFGENLLLFEACTTLEFNFSVHWRFLDDGESIQVAITRPTDNEYIGFAFSQGTDMISNSAVIAFAKPNGTTFASDYRLMERSSEGVLAGQGGQGLRNTQAKLQNGVLTAIFTRPLAPEDEDLPIIAPGAEVPIIYAVGEAPDSGRQLRQHASRRAATLELVRGELSTSAPPMPCVVSFNGVDEEFQACESLDFGVDVYWRFPDEREEIEVLLEKTTDSEYMGFAFSTGTTMVPNSAIISFPTADGSAFAEDYRLMNRSTEGVVAGEGGQELTSLMSQFSDGKLKTMFSRPLQPQDGQLPALNSASDEATSIIWAVGAAPSSGNQLTRHTQRQAGTLMLSRIGSLIEAPGVNPPVAQTLMPTPSPAPVAINCTTQVGDIVELYQRCQALDLGVQVFWRFPQGEDVIEFAIQKVTDSEYVGFAFSASNSMVPSSAVIAFPTADGGSFASDYALTSRSSSGVLANQGNQGLTSLESNFTDGVITAFFTRPLAPPPSATGQEFPALDPEGDVTILWSVGEAPDSGNVLTQHTGRRAGILDLSGADVVATAPAGLSNEFIAHAVLMSVAWLLLVPIGIMFARYFKNWGPWFQVHRAVQALAVTLGTAGWILALAKGSHAFIAHMTIGSIVSILGILQVVGGLARPHAPKEEEEASSLRKVWYLCHSNLGRLAGILAVVNIFLGINLSPTTAGGPTRGYNIGVGAYLAGLAVAFVIQEFFKIKRSKASTAE